MNERGILFDLMRERALVALLSTVGFAFFAWLIRGVDGSGAVAGWAVAFTLWLAGGPRAFAVLLAVFCVTWAATRFGYQRKLRSGIAERRAGRRNAAQVLANTGAAAALAALAPAGWVAGAVAALCETAADTVSSEIGQAVGGTPRLITSFRPVEPGTDGAISAAGTFAGIGSAVVVASVAVAIHWLDVRQTMIAAAAGIAGMLLDSLLGATLERRGWLDNDWVNAASTISAGVSAWLLCR